MPSHLKKSINQAHLENGANEQIVSSHLQNELELNGLEAPDVLQINTGTQQATQRIPESSEPTCHHCKKPGHHKNQCRQPKLQKDQAQNNTKSAVKNKSNTGGQTNSNSNKTIPNNTNASNTNNRNDRVHKLVYRPCETCG